MQSDMNKVLVILDLILLHLLEDRDSDSALGRISSLVTDSGRIGRGAGGKPPVLSLDEPVRDSQHGVDDNGVNSLGDLVLYRNA